MAESFRCPNCGALNPSGAEWCGQCLTRFQAAAPPPPPPPPAGAPAGATRNPSAPPAARPQLAGLATGARGPFTVTEDGITWRCTRCDSDNPLAAPVCAVCGTTFADSMRPPKERVERDPNTVALYSLFFPGAGHWYIDMKGQAIARGVLSVWVVFVALLGGVQGSLALALPFALAAFALWAIAAHDAYREARGESAAVILKGRAFMYVVFGLLLLMFLLLVGTGLRAR